MLSILSKVQYTVVPTFIPSPTTLIPKPTLTHEPITETVPPTVQIVAIKPDPDEPECERPESLIETGVDVVGPAFCIVWLDKFDDEQGFQIHLDYLQSSERFVYEVGADTTQLIVPESDAPRLGESFEQCLRRKDFMVKVIAQRADTEWLIDSMAVNVECARSEDFPLPTATPIP